MPKKAAPPKKRPSCLNDRLEKMSLRSTGAEGGGDEEGAVEDMMPGCARAIY